MYPTKSKRQKHLAKVHKSTLPGASKKPYISAIRPPELSKCDLRVIEASKRYGNTLKALMPLCDKASMLANCRQVLELIN